jgi:hypothetical protein
MPTRKQNCGCGFSRTTKDTSAASRLRIRVTILSQIVGNNEVRAVGRHLDPETLHFVVFGKAFDFQALALLEVARTPIERIDSLVRLLSTRLINLTISFERTVVHLLKRLNEQHQVFGRIPGVHQHRLKGQLLVIDRVA